MVEGARLEIVCALIPYRGFESLALRHLQGFGFAKLYYPVLTISSGHTQQRESIVARLSFGWDRISALTAEIFSY